MDTLITPVSLVNLSTRNNRLIYRMSSQNLMLTTSNMTQEIRLSLADILPCKLFRDPQIYFGRNTFLIYRSCTPYLMAH